MTESVDS